jgi:hypothetical protein
LTTRMGIRIVAPFGAGVGSEGTDTASSWADGDGAALTTVGLTVTIASPTAAVARRKRRRVRPGDSAPLTVITGSLNQVCSRGHV